MFYVCVTLFSSIGNIQISILLYLLFFSLLLRCTNKKLFTPKTVFFGNPTLETQLNIMAHNLLHSVCMEKPLALSAVGCSASISAE